MTPAEIIETIERLVWLADNGERPSRGELEDAKAAVEAVRNMAELVISDRKLDQIRNLPAQPRPVAEYQALLKAAWAYRAAALARIKV